MIPFQELLRALVAGKVDFLLVGGVAGNLHGANRITRDLDALYRRHPRNHERIVDALTPWSLTYETPRQTCRSNSTPRRSPQAATSFSR